MNKMKKILAMLLSLAMIIALIPANVYAKDGDEILGLTVGGVNAFETDSGEGWSYDADTNTLTLNGYNGGAIIAHCDLTIKLAAGSTNKITAESGIALGNEVEFGTHYIMNIVGEGETRDDAVLELSAETHAIHVVGNLDITNCTINATSTDINEEIMQSEDDLTITNCSVTTTKGGRGPQCFDSLTIKNSYIEANVADTGIQANNENLVIEDSELNITINTTQEYPPIGAGLQSQFGCVKLTNCSGTISAPVGISVEQGVRRPSSTETTDIVNCDLKIISRAPHKYGMLIYSDLNISSDDAEKSITFSTEDTVGIYSSGITTVSGEGVINAENCTQGIRAMAGYEKESSATVNGIIWTNNDVDVIVSGICNRVADRALTNRNVIINDDVKMEVKEGQTLYLSDVQSFTNNGEITNNGTMLINGDVSTNNGTIINNAVVTENEDTAIVNDGTIKTLCNNVFSVIGNEIVIEHIWDEGQVTTPPTTTSKGEKTFTCTLNSEHTRTEEIEMLEAADYSAVKAAIEKANALVRDDYVDLTAVDAAVNAVDWDKSVAEQSEVDAMAQAIETAIANLQRKPEETTTPAETTTEAKTTKSVVAPGKKPASSVNGKMSITWKKVKNADGYDIYVVQCGKKFKKKNIAKSVKNAKKVSASIKKLSGKKLKANAKYKIKVRAYKLVDGKKKYVASSLTYHIVGNNHKKYTNAKKVTVSSDAVSLKVNASTKIQAKVVKADKSKKMLSKKHGKKIRYISMDESVAVVNSNGKITAKAAGTCSVYVVALNGASKKIKVTVQ